MTGNGKHTIYLWWWLGDGKHGIVLPTFFSLSLTVDQSDQTYRFSAAWGCQGSATSREAIIQHVCKRFLSGPGPTGPTDADGHVSHVSGSPQASGNGVFWEYPLILWHFHREHDDEPHEHRQHEWILALENTIFWSQPKMNFAACFNQPCFTWSRSSCLRWSCRDGHLLGVLGWNLSILPARVAQKIRKSQRRRHGRRGWAAVAVGEMGSWCTTFGRWWRLVAGR